MPIFNKTQTSPVSLSLLNEIEIQAKKDNVHLVPEIFVANAKGELFGQKRAANRRLYPNVWDVAGGHMDSGETLFECIKRELKEETNWDLDEILYFTDQEDWVVPVEAQIDGDNSNKRMVRFLVSVKNIDELILEEGKVSEFQWFSKDNLERLTEGRNSNDLFRLNSFKQVFEYLE